MFVTSTRLLPTGKMDSNMIEPVQEILCWDKSAKVFKCQIVWDSEGKKWFCFASQ
jgi:hypothetical protein